MSTEYRRPGVYVEESLLTGANDFGSSASTFLFVGAAPKGRSLDPVRIQSWSDFQSEFGTVGEKVAFREITDPGTGAYTDVQVVNYLPYAVYSFFQNGGRVAYIQRAFSADVTGDAASAPINAGTVGTPVLAFTVEAKSPGTWGGSGVSGKGLAVASGNDNDPDNPGVYTFQVFLDNVLVETFSAVSVDGDVPGTKRIDEVINDPVYGSAYIRIVDHPNTAIQPGNGVRDYTNLALTPLAGGEDPTAPTDEDMLVALTSAVGKIDSATIACVAGYLDPEGTYVGVGTPDPEVFDGADVIFIDDFIDPRQPGTTSSTYTNQVLAAQGARNFGSSYVAAYTPWIIVPNPGKRGATISIPPAGAVMGVIGRMDAIKGVFRAPAGIEAVVTNALGVDTKFSEAEQGELNSKGVNVIRPVTGRGICVMGARTRKRYAADKYLSARRTLIYLRETMKAATEFAVFENNDNLLWQRMSGVADRILRGVWTSGGLRGSSPSDAYFIRCDSTINTPATIASGEVRMDIGVALEYPAEFVVIRLTQFEQGGSSVEVQPSQ